MAVGLTAKTKDWAWMVADLKRRLSSSKMLEAFQDSARHAYEVAYRLCPVDTGWMKGQLHVEVTGSVFNLKCDCDYAEFNEYGWHGVPVGSAKNPVHYKGGYRPFMRPGILAAQKYFRKKLKEQVEK